MPLPVRLALYLALAALAALAALGGTDAGGVGHSIGLDKDPMNLFCLAFALVVAAIGLLELRARGLRRSLPVALFLLVACEYLVVMREFPMNSPDWFVYEYSSQTVARGQDPYTTKYNYLYPPLFVQVLSRVHCAFDPQWAAGAASPNARAAARSVHQLFQSLQYCLVLASFALLAILGRRWGMSENAAAGLAALLVSFNSPLMGTLVWNQVNLIVLVSVLGALVLFERRPFLAGACLALGVDIKIYPVLLLLPFLARRRFWPLAGAAAAGAALFLFETAFLTDFRLWRQFVARMADFPLNDTLINQSLYGFIANTIRLAAGPDAATAAAKPLFSLCCLALVILAAWRFWQREKLGAAAGNSDAARLHGHLADMIALSLLLSPMIWQHHFVLALPLVAWMVVTRGPEQPGLAFLALLLVCVIPLFYAWPLQYHRLAGIGLVLWLTRPSAASLPFGSSLNLERRLSALSQKLSPEVN